MQAVDALERLFESVKVTLSTGATEVLEVDVVKRRINIDVENKAFLKRVISMIQELGNQAQDANGKQNKKKRSPLSMLGPARTVANALKTVGITITLSYQDDVVVTIGAAAKPKLLWLITRTKAIAINNLPKLIKMIR